MPKFNYIAIDKANKSSTGVMEAADRMAVIDSIVKQGLRPISIREGNGKKEVKLKGLLTRNKVKSDELVVFTRQLSTMIGAGVPLLRALNSLSSYSESAALKKVLENVIAQVESGAALGDALGKHPGTFSDVYVNMVHAGEAAGILDDILKRLALQQEKNATMRKKIKGAMTYPVVLLVIMVLAFFGLMLFVIPQIGDIIKDLGGPDAELPVLTQVMLGISSAILSFWYIILPVLGVGIHLLLKYMKTPTGKKQFHTLVLKIPAIRTIIQKVAVARFARTFSALMGAGVAVLEALNVTGHAIGNVVYEEALLTAGEEVKNGKQLSDVISGYDMLFPPIVAQMLAVGEETGQTDTVLIKVADFYEEEVDVAIDGLSSIIEPLMIVTMGSMVGLIAASVMGPIAGLSNTIQE